MNNPLTEVKPFVYTNPQGLQLEVLFVLDPEKKGYINATAIAWQFGKVPNDWLRNQHTQSYIQELLNDMNQSHSMNSQNVTNSNSYDNSLIPFMSGNSRTSLKSISYDDLVVTTYGTPENGGGTWLHPKLAVIFARWLSAHFAVWCDKKIAELLQQNPEYKKQFPELSVIFEKLEQHQHRTDQRFEQVADMFNNLHTKLAQDNKHALGQIFNGINQLNKTLSQQQQADLLKPPVEVGIKQTLVDYQHSSFKAQGWSWQRIAQELNARGTVTVSGTGQWHGSSVKRYVESHAAG